MQTKTEASAGELKDESILSFEGLARSTDVFNGHVQTIAVPSACS